MPASDELLLKLIYQEENKQALADAQARLENMSEAEKKFMQYEAEDAKLLASEMDKLTKAQEGTADSSEQATSGFSKMQAGIVTLNSVIGVAKEGIEIFKKGWDFAKEGAAIQRIGAQWAATAQDFGVNGDKIVAAVDKVTGRTLDDEAIMQAASRTLTQGLVSDGDQIVQMFEIAQAMAVRFGGSAIDAYEAESMAIETGQARMLRRQGIVVDFEGAYQKYAVAVGKTADALDEETKKEIRRNEILEAGQKLVVKVGDATNDSLSKMQRFERSVGDITDSLKEAAVDAFIPHLDNLKMLETALDGNATQADKLRAAYQQLVSMGYDPASMALVELQKQIDAADQSMERSGKSVLTYLNEAIGGMSGAIGGAVGKISEAIIKNKATDLSTMTPAKQAEASKAYRDYQDKLVGIEDKGSADREKIVQDALDSLNKLEADNGQKRADIVSKFAADEAARLSDMHDKRIEIISNYAEAEQKITDQQNSERLALARNYGVEVQHMEEDHQRSMARMQEDHGRRMSRLADSRDALGLQDEQENYEIERRRAEEDYQTGAQRKNEDYARQLADQNASFEAQRQAAKENEQKQLTALDEQFAKQDTRYKAAYDKQLKDFDKATQDQKFAIQTAEYKKLQDLSTSLADERTKTNAAWTQWRNEHDIFFAGERKAYDAYLKYTYDQLQAYIKGGGTIPTTEPITGGVPTTGSPFRAMGGRVDPFGSYIVGEHGPERLRMGRQGGYVSPGMGALRIDKVEINIPNTNATTEQIYEAVYAGIANVMQAAMR